MLPTPLPARPLAASLRFASPLGRPLFAGVLVATVGVALGFVEGQPLAPGLLPGLLGLLFGLVLLGNFYPPSGIFGRPLLRGPQDRPLVALTFDDGPDPVSTPRVLELLRRHDVRATFFVIGDRAARHPELLAALARDGHQIENHSLHHSWATPFLPRARLRRELETVQELVARGCGQAPRWFRPPIGILSPPVAAAAARLGLRLCGWSCKSRDGLGSTTAATALERLTRGLAPGAILLLHDASEDGRRAPVAPEVLEALLPLLASRGLRAVTLDELCCEPLAEPATGAAQRQQQQ